MEEICEKCKTKRITLEGGERLLEEIEFEPCYICINWVEENI